MIVDGVKVNFFGMDIRGRVSESVKVVNIKLCNDGLVDAD